ncbi:CBO0543 family protein [Gorillibacterium sp. sgz5001074]|uniref:CBO0543 family protein n=1 Tax=Gorillibacterium sp. sgz5001074 TaxID=3446695 RepID=UPI003F6777AD
MTDNQEDQLRSLSDQLATVTQGFSDYWKTYSSFGSWQFWVCVLVLVLPLVALVFFLDRKMAFRVGFFGLAIHLIATHVDLYATSHHLWAYPYKISPYPPASFGLDGSLIAATFMLFYQWTLHHRKNYYLYLILYSLMFAYGIKPLLSAADLYRLDQASYWLVFLLFYAGGLLGKWVTDLFVHAQKKEHSV